MGAYQIQNIVFNNKEDRDKAEKKKEVKPLKEDDIKRIKMVAETLGIPENELEL